MKRPEEYTLRDAIKLVAAEKKLSTDKVLDTYWMKFNTEVSTIFKKRKMY